MRPFVVVLAMVPLVPAYGAAQTAHWVEFLDAQTGLSFPYPPDLCIRRRDLRKFGLPRVESIVDLDVDTRTNPRTTVLRFTVKRGYASSAD